MKTRRKHEVGDVVGPFLIVAELPSDKNGRVFLLVHEACGRARSAWESDVCRIESGKVATCWRCHADANRKPQRCKHCETTDPADFGKARKRTACMACDRKIHRNGLCATCGARPASSKDGVKTPCARCLDREVRAPAEWLARASAAEARVFELETLVARLLAQISAETAMRKLHDRRSRERLDAVEQALLGQRKILAPLVAPKASPPETAELGRLSLGEREIVTCWVDDCSSVATRRHGVCARHRQQLVRFGEIRPDTAIGHAGRPATESADRSSGDASLRNDAPPEGEQKP